MNIPLMDLKRQTEVLRSEINLAINKVVDAGSFINGSEVKEFEKCFAEKHGFNRVIGCSNGTTSLHVILHSLGIGPGDEVITTPFTFIATVEAIIQSGAKPIFIDIELDTYCLNPELIEAAISTKTKAIMPVHIYGHPANMDRITEIANKHGLRIIEDCAQAHFAEWNGRKIGTFGVAASFSFYPGKNLGAFGDAGGIGVMDQELGEKLAQLVDHGRKDKYRHNYIGFNYRMDEIQAAILNVKVSRVISWTERRRQLAHQYISLLSGIPGLQLPKEDSKAKHVYHLFVVQVENRARYQEVLMTKGIATGVHYPIPLHLQPGLSYLGHREGDFPKCENLAANCLSLPLFPEMTEVEMNFVVSEIKKV